MPLKYVMLPSVCSVNGISSKNSQNTKNKMCWQQVVCCETFRCLVCCPLTLPLTRNLCIPGNMFYEFGFKLHGFTEESCSSFLKLFASYHLMLFIRILVFFLSLHRWTISRTLQHLRTGVHLYPSAPAEVMRDDPLNPQWIGDIQSWNLEISYHDVRVCNLRI